MVCEADHSRPRHWAKHQKFHQPLHVLLSQLSIILRHRRSYHSAEEPLAKSFRGAFTWNGEARLYRPCDCVGRNPSPSNFNALFSL